uniref:BLTX142 n=1 Tax=Nephila pilipes TaxID=299642 RepID=A0A076L1V3_NEPPI|nr:BLTX142 [Nephila pilipes]
MAGKRTSSRWAWIFLTCPTTWRAILKSPRVPPF